MQVEDWQACWRALSEIELYKRLPGIKVPTKVIAGELDTAFPPEAMDRDIASQISGARLIVIPGAAHLIALEKGLELATVLLGSSTWRASSQDPSSQHRGEGS